MNQRRSFLKMASSAAIPAAAAVLASGAARGDDGSVKEFLGSWSTIHSLPFDPPGPFHEFLSFEEGGTVRETNSFLHNTSNLNFLITGKVINASDGFGNYYRVSHGVIQVAFRKMLFDSAHQNDHFGDLHVTGTLHSDGTTIRSDNWHIEVLDRKGVLIADFGSATSQGRRIV
jgi:hypothetical protein